MLYIQNWWTIPLRTFVICYSVHCVRSLQLFELNRLTDSILRIMSKIKSMSADCMNLDHSTDWVALMKYFEEICYTVRATYIYLYTIGCTIEPPIVWYIQKCMLIWKNCFYFSFVFAICSSKKRRAIMGASIVHPMVYR